MKKLSILLLSLAFLMLAYSSPMPVHATATAPILGGWGGPRLKDAVPNATAPTSLVFSGEKMSNFEQETKKLADTGYNTVRASFAPTCSIQYGLQTQYTGAGNEHFMGDYNATQLGRAINVASFYGMYIVVDYHGYADFFNSTVINCWHNFWSPVIVQFKNSYSGIIWEPLNEPNDVAGGTGSDAVQTAAISSAYQNFLNLARSLGDTHWIVVQNLCSFGCGRFVESYYLDYPTVNDTAGMVFESLHTYMDYNNTAFHTDCHGTCTVWSNSTADIVARSYYLDFKNQTAWPNFSTEGGTSCAFTCPYVVTGSAGYSKVSFHFIQALINYEDNASPRIGRLLWVEAAWTNTPGAGVYGALNPGQWGTLITTVPVTTPMFVLTPTVWSCTLIPPRGQPGSCEMPFTVTSLYDFTGTVTFQLKFVSILDNYTFTPVSVALGADNHNSTDLVISGPCFGNSHPQVQASSGSITQVSNGHFVCPTSPS
jgi:hypothetical protein